MLERVGLGGAADKRVDELSGGQRQRVAIARSLVLEPTLLLLDEPLGALDLKLREHMKIELKQLQAAFGTTFVYITHDQSEALVLSDHVGVMSQGRFEQLGTPQDLYYRPQTPFVASFVGANNRIVGRVTAPGRRVGGNHHGRRLGHARAQERRDRRSAMRSKVSCARKWPVSGAAQADLPAATSPAHAGEVQSVLFDGANSAVLLQEARTRREFRIALPQTGQFSDLKPHEKVCLQLRSRARRVLSGARRGGGTGCLARPCTPAGRDASGWVCCWRRRCSGSAR